MKKKFIVKLTKKQRLYLRGLVGKGNTGAQVARRARILLKADVSGPAWIDARVAEALDCSRQCVENVRRRFCERGLEMTVLRKPYVSSKRKPLLDGEGEARLTALACGVTPDGRKRWTLRMLADKLVAMEVVDTISHETVRQTLKKTI